MRKWCDANRVYVSRTIDFSWTLNATRSAFIIPYIYINIYTYVHIYVCVRVYQGLSYLAGIVSLTISDTIPMIRCLETVASIPSVRAFLRMDPSGEPISWSIADLESLFVNHTAIVLVSLSGNLVFYFLKREAQPGTCILLSITVVYTCQNGCRCRWEGVCCGGCVFYSERKLVDMFSNYIGDALV